MEFVHAEKWNPFSHPQLLASSLARVSSCALKKGATTIFFLVKSLLPSSGECRDDRRRGFTQKTGKTHDNWASAWPEVHELMISRLVNGEAWGQGSSLVGVSLLHQERSSIFLRSYIEPKMYPQTEPRGGSEPWWSQPEPPSPCLLPSC